MTDISIICSIVEKHGYKCGLEYDTSSDPSMVKIWLHDPVNDLHHLRRLRVNMTYDPDLEKKVESIVAEFKNDIKRFKESEVENDGTLDYN